MPARKSQWLILDKLSKRARLKGTQCSAWREKSQLSVIGVFPTRAGTISQSSGHG
jgi:hypothetical protein